MTNRKFTVQTTIRATGFERQTAARALVAVKSRIRAALDSGPKENLTFRNSSAINEEDSSDRCESADYKEQPW